MKDLILKVNKMTWWKLAPNKVRVAASILSFILIILLIALPMVGKLVIATVLALITLIWCFGTVLEYVMDYDSIKRKHERNQQ